MLFENEEILKVDKQDLLDISKVAHEVGINKFYWKKTYNPIFLYEYQKKLAEQYYLSHKFYSKYMNGKKKNYKIDTNNEIIFVQKELN